jgi:hypothetical protein
MTATIINPCLAGSLKADHSGVDRSYSYTMIVETTSPNDGPAVVRFAAGMPHENVTHYSFGNETDFSALCRKLSPKAVSPTLWEVDVTFSTKVVGPRKGDPAQQVNNPLDRPPIVRFRTQRTEYVMVEDLNRKPFINSAGMPYDPELCKRGRSLGILSIQANLEFPDYSTWGALIDGINDKAFYMADIGCARFDEITSEWKNDNAIWFVDCNFTFTIEPLGWNSKYISGLVDLGSQWKADDVGLTYFKDANGVASTEPHLLDGKGKPLAAGSAAVINEFKRYYTGDFSALGIGG